MSAVSDVLSAAGGVNGIGEGAGSVICAIKGTCAPKNLTVINNNDDEPGSNNNMILLIGGGLVVVVVLLMMFKE